MYDININPELSTIELKRYNIWLRPVYYLSFKKNVDLSFLFYLILIAIQ